MVRVFRRFHLETIWVSVGFLSGFRFGNHLGFRFRRSPPGFPNLSVSFRALLPVGNLVVAPPLMPPVIAQLEEFGEHLPDGVALLLACGTQQPARRGDIARDGSFGAVVEGEEATVGAILQP